MMIWYKYPSNHEPSIDLRQIFHISGTGSDFDAAMRHFGEMEVTWVNGEKDSMDQL